MASICQEQFFHLSRLRPVFSDGTLAVAYSESPPRIAAVTPAF